MSSETDHPRQRTVAELLAEHGDAGATGRRRRRRAADGPDDDAGVPEQGSVTAAPAATATEWRPAPPALPDRSVLREPVPREQAREVPAARAFTPEPAAPAPEPPPGRRAPGQNTPGQNTGAYTNGTHVNGDRNGAGHNGAGLNGAGVNGAGLNGAGANGTALNGTALNGSVADGVDVAPTGGNPAGGYPPEGLADGGRTGAYPTSSQPLAPLRRPPHDQARDRPTDVMPRLREERTGALDPGLTGPITQQRPATAPDDEKPDASDDDGPPTMIGAAPTGAESWHRARTSRRAAPDADGGPPTQASAGPIDFDDPPAGLGDDDLEELEGYGADTADAEPRRRLGRSAAASSPGQAWAAVVAQWIVGAIGGAALWVGFRFMWRSLPVVALAAAVLVTVGLVVIVRALLRNNDTRTTVFAVLVGLLLTVSPAILVLLGR